MTNPFDPPTDPALNDLILSYRLINKNQLILEGKYDNALDVFLNANYLEGEASTNDE